MAAPIKVLFLCTGNACRSQMAEALLRHVGGERFEAASAGSHPAGYVHPLTVRTMDHLGVDMTGQYSKSWDEFAEEHFDLVITICDAAAAETCPVWPGAPLTVHWPHPDPVAVIGSEEARTQSAIQVANDLKRRIEALCALDFANTSPAQLRKILERIGRE